MSSCTIEGVVHEVSEPQQKTEKFSLREAIIQTDDKYAPLMRVQMNNKNMDLLNPSAVGHQVRVSCNIKGMSQPYNGRYFNPTLEVWKVEKMGQVPDMGQAPPQYSEPPLDDTIPW